MDYEKKQRAIDALLVCDFSQLWRGDNAPLTCGDRLPVGMAALIQAKDDLKKDMTSLENVLRLQRRLLECTTVTDMRRVLKQLDAALSAVGPE